MLNADGILQNSIDAAMLSVFVSVVYIARTVQGGLQRTDGIR